MVKGGKGDLAGILENEDILEINGKDTCGMVHLIAQKLIKNTGFSLNLILDKSGTIFDLPKITEEEQIVDFPSIPRTEIPRNEIPRTTIPNKRLHNPNRTVRILRSNSTDNLNQLSPCIDANRFPVSWKDDKQHFNYEKPKPSSGSGIFTSLMNNGDDQNKFSKQTVRNVKPIRTESKSSGYTNPGTPTTPITPLSPILAPQWPARNRCNEKITNVKQNDSCERLFTFSVSTRTKDSPRPASANACMGVQKQSKDANDTLQRIRIYNLLSTGSK